MIQESFRKELTDYYYHHANENAEAFCVRVLPIMDAAYRDGMSAYEMKALQYRIIADEFEPVLFRENPFYYETGTIAAHSDGARDFRDYRHAGGWTHWKNDHLFDGSCRVFDAHPLDGTSDTPVDLPLITAFHTDPADPVVPHFNAVDFAID